MPADGRQDLRGHPALGTSCRGQLASEDQGVQAHLRTDSLTAAILSNGVPLCVPPMKTRIKHHITPHTAQTIHNP